MERECSSAAAERGRETTGQPCERRIASARRGRRSRADRRPQGCVPACRPQLRPWHRRRRTRAHRRQGEWKIDEPHRGHRLFNSGAAYSIEQFALRAIVRSRRLHRRRRGIGPRRARRCLSQSTRITWMEPATGMAARAPITPAKPRRSARRSVQRAATVAPSARRPRAARCDSRPADRRRRRSG